MSQNNERHVSGSIKVSGSIEANIPHSLVSKQDAERKEDKASDKARFWVEIATLFAVAAYTSVAVIQGCLMSQSNNLILKQATTAREAFEASSRPYVGFGGVTVTYDPKRKLMQFRVRIANNGTIPAENVQFHWRTFFNDKEFPNGESAEQVPTSIDPGGDQSHIGTVAQWTYDDVMTGKEKLTVYLYWKYSWRDHNEERCIKTQYEYNLKAFIDYGPVCALK